MKNPVSKEEIRLWLESGLVDVIRDRAAELGLHMESLIEDALFELFEPLGLQRIYGGRVPPQVKFRVKDDAENFRKLDSSAKE